MRVFRCLLVYSCFVYICYNKGEGSSAADCSVTKMKRGQCYIITQPGGKQTSGRFVTWNNVNRRVDSCKSSPQCCAEDEVTSEQDLCVHIRPECQSSRATSSLIEQSCFSASGAATFLDARQSIQCSSSFVSTSSMTSNASSMTCPGSMESLESECCLYYYLICSCMYALQTTETATDATDPTTFVTSVDSTSSVTTTFPSSSDTSSTTYGGPMTSSKTATDATDPTTFVTSVDSTSSITTTFSSSSDTSSTTYEGPMTSSTSEASSLNLKEILHLLEVLNSQCGAKVGDCSGGIIDVVIAIERQLKKLAQDLLSHDVAAVTMNNFEMAAQRVDCVNVTTRCDANVTFTENDIKLRMQSCNQSLFVAVAQIMIRSEIASKLIADARTGLHGNVSYVIAPDGIPYVSVASYDDVQECHINAAVNFTWNGSYAIALTNQLLPLARADGDQVFLTSIEPRCGFIDTRSGKISSLGCRVRESRSMVECECNHTTVFAILLAVNARVVPLGVKICSYVTETLSVTFLTITIVILFRYKERIKSDRTMIQIHLSVSLLLLHILLLTHDLLQPHDEWCAVAAVSTHFFLLSSAMWMTVEGMRLYLLTSNHVLRYGTSNLKKRAVFNLLVGWGVPFFLTTVFAGIGWILGSYMKESYLYKFQEEMGLGADLPKYDYCWLDSTKPVYFAFVTAPVSLALLFNLGITLKVFVRIVQMNYFSNAVDEHRTFFTNLKSTFKALLILLTTLGLPWIIGFFTGLTSFHASVVMMYLNVVMNGLQGVFVFILYCLRNPYVSHRIDSSTIHISFMKNAPKSQ